MSTVKCFLGCRGTNLFSPFLLRRISAFSTTYSLRYERPTGNSSGRSFAFQKNLSLRILPLTAYQGGLMDWDPKGILQVCKKLQYNTYMQIKWMVIIPCFQVQFLDHGHVTPHRVLHPEAGAMVLRMKVQWSTSEVETPMPRFPQVASPQAICIENTQQRYSTCLVGSNSWRLAVFMNASPNFIQLLYKQVNKLQCGN